MNIPANLILQTNKVILRPLSENDFDAFFQLAQEEDAWTFFTLNLADKDHLRKWMDQSLSDCPANLRRPFTIIEKLSGTIAGSMSLLNISAHDLRLEIGGSWLGKEFRGTDINRHSKYAIMKFSFEEMGFERVEFKTDVLNTRARKALEKIGGKQEGIFRNHMTMWNNRRRDSVYYSIIKAEWPLIKHTIFEDIEQGDENN